MPETRPASWLNANSGRLKGGCRHDCLPHGAPDFITLGGLQAHDDRHDCLPTQHHFIAVVSNLAAGMAFCFSKMDKLKHVLPQLLAFRYTATLTSMLLKLSFAVLAAAAVAVAQPSHLTDLHQLTHGGQNAEAYWSPDGKRLIFQTTRPPYDCDQIFVMNADGSDQHLVSTGKGRTTCGYFLADNKHIVYASTHLADAACPAPVDRSRGYVWGVFSGYDIFLATDAGKIEKQLTNTAGYDAEATVNWKTGTIIYTSLASKDLDLWTMKPDGSSKKQITSKPGYDGGAAFSRDGSKIVWRANYPQTSELMATYKALLADNLTAPMKMEIVVANGDGSKPKQLTNFGCASFAPTFSPDGKQIIFASNKHDCDSRYFELYKMNVDGTGLEQVTNFKGFTSFPEFSPDGKTLVFCSDKDAKERYEFNIFTAKWTSQVGH